MLKDVGTLIIPENANVCYNCEHFVQHYIYYEDYERFLICNAGHCVKPRIKPRKPDHKACEHFEKKGEQVNV